MENTRMTRQLMANDSHVLEQIPENVEIETHPEDDDFNNFLEDSRFMEKLYNLRNKAFSDVNSISSPPEFRRIMNGMDQDNILPSRTRRRVTFATQ